VEGSPETALPTTKTERKNTGVTQIPPIELKPNAATPSYVKFGKLPPSADIETQLNKLINGVPVTSLVNAMVAWLFEHVTVYFTFRITIRLS